MDMAHAHHSRDPPHTRDRDNYTDYIHRDTHATPPPPHHASTEERRGLEAHNRTRPHSTSKRSSACGAHDKRRSAPAHAAPAKSRAARRPRYAHVYSRRSSYTRTANCQEDAEGIHVHAGLWPRTRCAVARTAAGSGPRLMTGPTRPRRRCPGGRGSGQTWATSPSRMDWPRGPRRSAACAP